jgi:hypothetical protein
MILPTGPSMTIGVRAVADAQPRITIAVIDGGGPG